MAIAGLYKCFDHWHQNGTLFIYSDTHFGENSEESGMINHPADETQVNFINSKVGRKDIFVHLGDVGNPEFIRKIRGYKILIMGNHDAGRSNYERQKWIEYFDTDKYEKKEALDKMKLLYPNCSYTIFEDYSLHSPFVRWCVVADNQLFDEVYEGPVMIGEKLILSHEPVNIPWAFNIHGHIHDTRHKNDKYHFNVCANIINYTPINFNQWMKQGYLSHIETIHRNCINKAAIRAKIKK